MINEAQNFDLRNISQQDFLRFGIQDVAYIKPIRAHQKISYAVYAADGTPLSIMEDFNMAMALVQQNDLQAVSIN